MTLLQAEEGFRALKSTLGMRPNDHQLEWFDTSAKPLGQSYRGFTRSLGINGKLRDLDCDTLAPSDLAVTMDGRHVLAYLGGCAWIQADPVASEVIIGHRKRDPISWFDSQVKMHRWVILE